MYIYIMFKLGFRRGLIIKSKHALTIFDNAAIFHAFVVTNLYEKFTIKLTAVKSALFENSIQTPFSISI